MNLRVDELSRSDKEAMVGRFDCEDLNFVTDEDLYSQNVKAHQLSSSYHTIA